MKVKDLIEGLSKLDPDMNIAMDDYDFPPFEPMIYYDHYDDKYLFWKNHEQEEGNLQMVWEVDAER